MKRQALNLMSSSQYISTEPELLDDTASMSQRLLADGTMASPYHSRMTSERKPNN